MAGAVRHRLYVAVDVEEPAHAALAHAVRPLRAAHPGLRWNEPSTWHVALAYLGSIPADRAHLVDEAAAAVARRPPLALRLDGRVGAFPGGVLFASVEDGPELSDVVRDLAERLSAAGLAVQDHREVAHCTLALVPRGSRLPGPLLGAYDGPAVTWTARRLNVVRSRLQVGGLAHEVRSSHLLAEDA